MSSSKGEVGLNQSVLLSLKEVAKEIFQLPSLLEKAERA